eukprot:3976081-Pleurochrysis_carterae.AAC.2
MITVQKRRREELLKGWPCSTQYPLLLPVPKRSGSGFSEAAANMASASSAPSCLPHAVLAFRPPSTPPRGLLTPDRGNRPALLWPGNGGTLWHAKLRSNLGQVEVGHATRSKDLFVVAASTARQHEDMMQEQRCPTVKQGESTAGVCQRQRLDSGTISSVMYTMRCIPISYGGIRVDPQHRVMTKGEDEPGQPSRIRTVDWPRRATQRCGGRRGRRKWRGEAGHWKWKRRGARPSETRQKTERGANGVVSQ